MRSSNVSTKRKEPTHSDITQSTTNGKRRRSNGGGGGGGGAGKTGRPQPGLVHNASKTLGRFTLPFWGAPDATRKTGQFMTKLICCVQASFRRFSNALTFGNNTPTIYMFYAAAADDNDDDDVSEARHADVCSVSLGSGSELSLHYFATSRCPSSSNQPLVCTRSSCVQK